MKKQQKENEQIARIIERDNIINFKKKTSNKPQKESDEEIQSANSLKSGVFSQDNNEAKFSKKNTPLPQLNRQRKKMFQKNMVTSQSKQINNYLEKQVRQQDNLVLKQKNNILSSQNMKLKTKVMALEKQIAKLTKVYQQDFNSKPKQPGLMPKDGKLKGSQTLSLKMTIKNLRKQLDEQKKENEKIKCSIKFTRISQLECERDQLLNQTGRLRQMIEQQMAKRALQKAKQQGLSVIQHKLQNMSQKNFLLMKQNSQLNKKVKLYQQSNTKFRQTSQNERNLNKMLFNAKRIIKEKQKEIQVLKVKTTSTETKIQSTASINGDPKSLKQVYKPLQNSRTKSKQKRIMSKSAQKYRKKTSQEAIQIKQCTNCENYKRQIQLLQKKIQELNLSLKSQKQNNARLTHVGQFSRQQISVPSSEQVERLSRFLVFRFKAHHLSYEQCQKYLINGQITQNTKKQQISIIQMAENLIAQPFSVLSSRYLQVILMKLFYQKQCDKTGKKTDKLKLDQQRKITKGQLLSNFAKFLKPYDIVSQQKQQEMFIQIAQLVTNYHQHILTALNRKKNGQGTITQNQLISFFNQIQLQKQFTQFIICQIILQSLDLEHLNYYTMFQIFYMPNQGIHPQLSEPNQPNKKKFQVDHSQVVKEQDQEYQQSKSHLDQKQKTQSNKNEQLQQQQEENSHSPSQNSQKNRKHDEQAQNIKLQARKKRNKSMKNVQAKLQKTKLKQKLVQQKQVQQNYQQQFEEQKTQKLPEQQKANEEKQQKQYKPYQMQEVYEEYVEQEEH